MSLRTQKRGGGQDPWKLDELKSGLEHFLNEYGRYPTATEIDAYPYLPAARSIERGFGGLVALRKRLKLEGNQDFRTGDHSTRRAHAILKRAHETEAAAYRYLCNHFGKEFVHREYLFTDDHRTRADFFVYDAAKGFCVDVFYAASRRNLIGCLNIKLKKYRYASQCMPYAVVYVQMNPEISADIMANIAKRKSRPLPKGQELMGWDEFKAFCHSRKPLHLIG